MKYGNYGNNITVITVLHKMGGLKKRVHVQDSCPGNQKYACLRMNTESLKCLKNALLINVRLSYGKQTCHTHERDTSP